ncbi:MAG: GEVED domain-containing protein [Pirellulaceae bacterium]
MSVVASAAGKLDAWIDFNRDGDWNDAGEQIAANIDVTGGLNLISFQVPAGSASGSAAARFRLSTEGGLAPTGAAADGEVEDYLFSLIDGDVAGGVDVRIDLPTSGSFDIDIDGENLVVRHGLVDLFNSAASQVKSLHIAGSSGDDTINIANVDAVFSGLISADGGDGQDRLALTQADQSLDLSVLADDVLKSIETFDIRGTGSNRIALTASDVIALMNAGNEVTLLMDTDDALDDISDDFTITGTEVVDDQFQLIATSDSGATLKIRGTNWTNPLDVFDVNNSDTVTPLDALVILNQLSRRNLLNGSTLIDPTTIDPFPFQFLDTTGDGVLTPLDALRILNHLNRISTSGEAQSAPTPLSATSFFPWDHLLDDDDEEESNTQEPEDLSRRSRN